jgi:hypothetical protein
MLVALAIVAVFNIATVSAIQIVIKEIATLQAPVAIPNLGPAPLVLGFFFVMIKGWRTPRNATASTATRLSGQTDMEEAPQPSISQGSY